MTPIAKPKSIKQTNRGALLDMISEGEFAVGASGIAVYSKGVVVRDSRFPLWRDKAPLARLLKKELPFVGSRADWQPNPFRSISSFQSRGF